MANRADINRLCSNLTQMGVEIKPEELQNLTKVTACRVMTDFVTVAFLASPELMNQQLAVTLENHNVNTALHALHANRVLLWRQGLALLSKGGAFTFDVSDLLRPEAKKFNQLLQQMLKYLFYSAKVYDAVSEESARLEEAAERIEKQRADLEFDKNELEANLQKIARLNAVNITQVLNLALEKKNKLTEETEGINNEYTELKTTLEKNKTDHFACAEKLSNAEAQLAELQDLVVTDPDSQVSALEQLRKEWASKSALLTSREKQIHELNSKLKLLEDKEQRASKILSIARNIGIAIEEFQQNTHMFNGRIADEQVSIADLQSELERLQANIESRNQQVQKIGDNERAEIDAIRMLEKEENLKKELLANCEKQKVPLANDINRLKQELNELTALAEDVESTALAELSGNYEEATERWKDHVNEVSDFRAECLKTESKIKQSYGKLVQLLQGIGKLD